MFIGVDLQGDVSPTNCSNCHRVRLNKFIWNCQLLQHFNPQTLMNLSVWVFWPLPLKNREHSKQPSKYTLGRRPQLLEGYLPADSSNPASTCLPDIYKWFLNISIKLTLKFRVVVELYRKEALQGLTTLALESIMLKKN